MAYEIFDSTVQHQVLSIFPTLVLAVPSQPSRGTTEIVTLLNFPVVSSMRFLVFTYRGNFHTSLFQTEHNGLSSLGWCTVQCDGLPFLHHLSTTSPQQASCKIIHFYVARKISCQQHLRNSYTYLQNLTLASAKYFIPTLLILKMKWFSIPELKYFISIC